ncbi:alpha-galactosidase [Oricola cellulosilytica]|uniref:alpha-galactosidase n=1 Tax=Oricola cellulosilytica TaxID=1429082 RepID=A0A4R0PHJ6_9HYPH|nr:alpha-galactosidase [Oricola cellulosilytica]TCD16323.1 alpha-galactosidase [Oricola cellulosilytica]
MQTSGVELKPVECWRLDGGGRTAVLASFAGGVPALVWYGPPLPEAEDIEALALGTIPNVSSGQLDPFVPLTLCPVATTGWQGHPGLTLLGSDGHVLLPDLRLRDAVASSDHALSFTVADVSSSQGVSLQIDVALNAATGLLSVATHAAAGNGVEARWVSVGAVPVPASMPRILDHGGRWCGEFQHQETRFRIGQHVRESREGRTGHANFPGVTFLGDSTGENAGSALGAALAWSGGHRMIAEELPDGRRQVQFAIAGDGVGEPGDRSPEMILGWSDAGLNGLMHAFHAHVRSLHERPVFRPVHYNCWEAVYFRHDVAELKEIAARAAELGAERFVLDDGWFKGRNDDTTSLGDWTVDQQKFPEGLKPLGDHVSALGMRFGIWFEPEMVNKDSDLYRAHPDWLLGPDTQPSGRNQFVLDLTSPGVADYLFERIDAILAETGADYVKWDHNRILTGGDARQTTELYALLARLREAHPGVDFESCASGGGRIDYGILAHAPRVWLSDSNDALERLRMQHEAARWLPPEFVGSHVGPRKCHTSGRVLPIAFRAWVAAQRHMGFEMDPRELTDDEADTLKRITRWWKDHRDFLFSSRLHLLESHDSEVFAEIFVAQDRERFILFKGQAGSSRPIAARPFALAGLDPEAIYDVRLVNPEDVAPVLNRKAATGLMEGVAMRLSGQVLMTSGLPLPNAFPATMLVVEGVRNRVV